MVAIPWTYQNDIIKPDRDCTANHPIKVIVTFPEEMDANLEAGISLKDFSFLKSQKILENYKGSFSHAVSEDRRSEDVGGFWVHVP